MNKLQFSQNEIQAVCNDLDLPPGAFGDLERKAILKKWDNCDIVACPGSGKTTVLLAKLLLLSRRMPFEKNKGICVLTHTNVGINEIKNKLGTKADILFQYPNFFGTIQAFVDRFLCIPANIKYFATRPNIIDSFAVNKKMETKFCKGESTYYRKLNSFIYQQILSHELQVKKKEFIKYLKLSNSEFDEIKTKLLSTKNKLKFQNIKDIKIAISELNFPNERQEEIENAFILKLSQAKRNANDLKFDKMIKWDLNYLTESIQEPVKKNTVCGFSTPAGSQFKKLKESLFYNGYLTFDDCFSLAHRYINDYEKMLRLSFSSRFKILFIDEMQDTQNHQFEIFKKIFNTQVIKQYYGDPDQSIFEGMDGVKTAWNIDSDIKLEITDSKRFGGSISKCIFPFRKEISKLNGNNQISSLKPYIILFDDEKDVLPKFVELIQSNKLDQMEWEKTCARFNAVGFVGKKPKDGKNKQTLHRYFNKFSKKTTWEKEHFNNLDSYFQKRPDDEINKKGSRIYYNAIFNALLELLDKGECINPNNDKKFTKIELEKFIKEKSEKLYFELQKKIAEWIKKIHFDKINDNFIKDDFINYFNSKLELFFPDFKKRSSIHAYIGGPVDHRTQAQTSKPIENIYSLHGVDIKLGTIHSVKGETHLATLLLETEYHHETESTYFLNKDATKSDQLLFCGVEKKFTKPRINSRLKTAYVAMSRPTKLLCVALKREHAKCNSCHKRNTEKCNWELINLAGQSPIEKNEKN